MTALSIIKFNLQLEDSVCCVIQYYTVIHLFNADKI